MKKLIFIILVFIIKNLQAQYPPAVEVWSEPVRIDSLAERFVGEWSAALTSDMESIFLAKGPELCSSIKVDTLWTMPIALNQNVNNGSPIRNPSISKDKKRLYFSRWEGFGGWDLWYSQWDTITNDWGSSINLGAGINSQLGEYFAYELSMDTLYCVNERWASSGVCVYVRDSISKEWEIIDSSNYYHPFGMGNIRGLSITGDHKKAYFSRYITLNSDSLQSELFVTFWDTVNNRWGDVFELNINSNAYQPDTTNNFYWIGGWDEYPWVSFNGKLLFFMSNRDVAREDTIYVPDIYMSILLYDENGNPVNVNEIPDLKMFLNDFLLFQNYPNPFNNNTKIRYYVPASEMVRIKIYDLTGQEIEEIVNEEQRAGLYEVEFNGNNLPSGVYFYKLISGSFEQSKKMILLK